MNPTVVRHTGPERGFRQPPIGKALATTLSLTGLGGSRPVPQREAREAAPCAEPRCPEAHCPPLTSCRAGE